MSITPVYQNKKAPCFSNDHLGQGGCPAINDIPSFLHAVSLGDYHLAFTILKKTNPFSGGCGRFCDHPCETACNRDKFDSSVDIRDMERFISEYGFEKNLLPKEVPNHRNKKIAIIGGGPAGLSAAYFLKKEGFAVDVFDMAPQMGGLMAQGIPVFRYPTKILRWEIASIKALGIRLHVNSFIDEEKLCELNDTYDYTIVATGTHKPRKLNIEGEKHPQVLVGLDFLKTFNNSEEFREKGMESSLVKNFPMGKDVAVVGGGYTAIDVARTAARLGKNVTVIYRRGKDDMSIHKGEVEECEKEGIQFRFFLSPQKIEEVEAGKNTRLSFTVEKMFVGEMGADGKSDIYASGEQETLVFDGIIKAIGETPDLKFLPQGYHIQGNHLLLPKAKNNNCFIAGDARYGYAKDVGMVVRAIGSGRNTADEILSIEDKSLPVRYEEKNIAFYQSIKKRYFKPKAKLRVSMLSPQERVKSFAELTPTISQAEAAYAASRCFYCGICVTCDWCFHYSHGAIVKVENSWDGDRSTRYFRFIKEYVTQKTSASVEACPRNAMALAKPEENQEQYVSLDTIYKQTSGEAKDIVQEKTKTTVGGIS